MKSFFTEIYGCQMNVSDSLELEGSLYNLGYTKALRPEEASVVIINTCAVRKTAEDRLFGRLGFFKHLKKTHSFDLFVIGCVAQKEKENLILRFPFIDYIIGTKARHKIIEILSQKNPPTERLYYSLDSEYSLDPIPDPTFPKRALMTIIHGCSKFCSYCIVPYTRGIEKSVSSTILLQQAQALAEQGVEELFLLGQNVNSYGIDSKDISFANLLNQLSEIDQIKKIRFISSHPWDLSSELINEIATNPKITKSLHLALQSASNKVLSQMNRQHSYEEYKSRVMKLKDKCPNISLSTDILVGYPGEEEEDFLMSLEALKEIEFTQIFAFMYSPREGTAAYFFDETVSPVEKQKRVQRVLDTQKPITQKILSRFIGQEGIVLAERISPKEENSLTGLNEFDIHCTFHASEKMIGEFVKVRYQKVSGKTLIGELIS